MSRFRGDPEKFLVVFAYTFLFLAAAPWDSRDGRSAFGQTIISGTIKGKIIDNRTVSPVAGVLVEITGTSISDTTDSNGVFGFTDIPVGLIELTVSAAGYVKQIVPDIQIMSGENKEVEIKVESEAKNVNEIVIRAPVITQKSGEQIL